MSAAFLPRALRVAAATFADQPRFLGEILVALYADGRRAKLTDVQRFIVAECREEIAERLRRRAAETERKRRQRKGGGK